MVATMIVIDDPSITDMEDVWVFKANEKDALKPQQVSSSAAYSLFKHDRPYRFV